MSYVHLQILLETTLIWSVLIGYFFWTYRNNRNWREQRRYLLVAWTCGWLLPLLPTVSVSAPVAAAIHLPAYVAPTVGEVVAGRPLDVVSLNWLDVAGWIWLLGATLSLSLYLYRLLGHLRLITSRGKHTEHFAGYRVVRHAAARSPFAAFGRVCLPNNLPVRTERSALLHEAAHLRCGHHYEQLLLLVGRVIFWFHPLAWVFSRTLSEIHEYEADAAVVREVPTRVYGYQLLRATLAPAGVPSLFSSPLKKRIAMLTDKTIDQKLSWARWPILIVLSIGLFWTCIAENDSRFLLEEEPLEFDLSDMDMSASAPKLLNQQQDDFISGFYDHIRYPEISLKRSEMGIVKVEMLIDKEGRIEDIITRKVMIEERNQDNEFVVIGVGNPQQPDIVISTRGTALPNAVRKALTEMEPFSPATVDGKPVRAQVAFDVTFMPEF